MVFKRKSEGGSNASALFTVCSSFSRNGKYFGVLLLALLVIQNTSAVLLARYTRTKYDYNVNHMLLVAEIIKLATSIFLEGLTFVKVEDEETMPITHSPAGSAQGKKLCCLLSRLSALCQSFKIHIFDNPKDALKLTIPAGLYLLQNTLVYISISLVPVPLFTVTQQTKLVTTALLSVILLKRTYDKTQWYSILALCVGAAICILSHHKPGSEESEESSSSTASSLFGLLLIVLSNFCGSIAGVYFELVIKGKESSTSQLLPSIWMRNIQLATFSICILCVKILSDSKEESRPFFYDFTPLLWIQITIFAWGGLLVAGVIKYTDSVQKGLAAGLSVISASALSMEIEGSAVSLDFIVGSILAIGGIFFFANPKLEVGRIPCPSAKSLSIKKIFGAMIFVIPFFFFMKDYGLLEDIKPHFTPVQ